MFGRKGKPLRPPAEHPAVIEMNKCLACVKQALGEAEAALAAREGELRLAENEAAEVMVHAGDAFAEAQERLLAV